MPSILAATVLLTANLGAAPSATDNDIAVAALREFLPAYRVENRIQSLSVAVARDGEVIFADGLGYQDHDGEEPTTADTSYLVASITKAFTGATLLAMEADGHLSLQDDFTRLSDWDSRCQWLAGSGIIFGGGAELDDGTVVEPVPCDHPITLEQVLSHQVNGRPGSDFLYNPVVFGRIANYVEEQTDRSWREWMNHYVIDRAGLENVAAGWRDPDKAHVLTQLAPPFRHTDRAVDPDGVDPSVLPNPELNASSGIISGVRGLAHYANALLEGRILGPALLERMWTPAPLSSGKPSAYGLGWWVQEIDGRQVVWHGGWWPDAYAGLLMIVPEERLVLVALGNTDGIHWGNPLNTARVQDNPLAAKVLDLFGE